MGVDDLEATKDLLVDRQVKTEILMHGSFLFYPPVPDAPSVLLHDDIVACLVDPIVKEVSDTVLQAELFKACDLSEYIVQNAPVLDGLRQMHLLDGDGLWLSQIGLALVHDTISSFGNLPPVLSSVIQSQVEERGAKKL